MKPGILYLVPTPIGNLGDMTYRGVETLKSVDIIACEDTRTSKKLLNHYQIKNRLIAYHKFNERKQTDTIISQLLEGKNIAVITDAGTPAISDPATILVKAAIERNIQVCCLPGASACITALAASGLDTESFVFIGFLPLKAKDRKALLQRLQDTPDTIVIYESSHRIIDTIKELSPLFIDRSFVLAREISKVYETFYREHFTDISFLDKLETRGEFVLMIEGKTELTLSDEQILSLIEKHHTKAESYSETADKVSHLYNLKRNRVYKLALLLKNVEKKKA